MDIIENEKKSLESKVIEFRDGAAKLNKLADKLEEIVGSVKKNVKSVKSIPAAAPAVNTRGWIACDICPLKHRARHPHIKQMRRREQRAA